MQRRSLVAPSDPHSSDEAHCADRSKHYARCRERIMSKPRPGKAVNEGSGDMNQQQTKKVRDWKTEREFGLTQQNDQRQKRSHAN